MLLQQFFALGHGGIEIGAGHEGAIVVLEAVHGDVHHGRLDGSQLVEGNIERIAAVVFTDADTVEIFRIDEQGYGYLFGGEEGKNGEDGGIAVVAGKGCILGSTESVVRQPMVHLGEGNEGILTFELLYLMFEIVGGCPVLPLTERRVKGVRYTMEHEHFDRSKGELCESTVYFVKQSCGGHGHVD